MPLPSKDTNYLIWPLQGWYLCHWYDHARMLFTPKSWGFLWLRKIYCQAQGNPIHYLLTEEEVFIRAHEPHWEDVRRRGRIATKRKLNLLKDTQDT
jgi:hypothetical protein